MTHFPVETGCSLPGCSQEVLAMKVTFERPAAGRGGEAGCRTAIYGKSV